MVIPGRSSRTDVREAELETLRLQLEAINLHGLAAAANALLGECPAVVCRVLSSWTLAQSAEWPRLIDQCWAALGPLRVGVPPGPAPQTLERVLAGRPADAQVVLDALDDCLHRADRVPVYPARLIAHAELDGEPWRRALLSTLEDFWIHMTDLCACVHPLLLRRDGAKMIRLLQRECVRLEQISERIEALANRVASADWTGIGSSGPISGALRFGPPEDTSDWRSTSDTGAVLPGPLTPSEWVGQPEQGRVPTAGPVLDQPLLHPPDEIQRWLPVVFLAVVTSLAIVVLITVAYGSPPG
jgi:hypothetical protein